MLTILIYALLAYWGLCALLAIASVIIFDCPEESTQQDWETLLHMRSPYREVVLVVGALVIAFVSPVMVPHCLIQGHLADRRRAAFFNWLKRTHRENVYEKIHPVNLPKVVRTHFEEGTPALLELGFRELGRYILKPEPAQSFGCCFQSADGRTIGALGHMFDSNYFSFSTLFENGMALETASIEETPNLASVNESNVYRAIFSPNASIADTYVRHEIGIADLEAEFDTRALAFAPEQFRDVLTYENRTYNQWLYETGRHDAPPPPAVLPTPIRSFDDDSGGESSEFAWEPTDDAVASV